MSAAISLFCRFLAGMLFAIAIAGTLLGYSLLFAGGLCLIGAAAIENARFADGGRAA